MKAIAHPAELKVADEVWIATALLHREHPDRGDFSVREIVDRAARENITGRQRPGVYVHAIQHAVANLPASPNRYRLLFATAADRRRLFREGDPANPGRAGSKSTPRREDLPAKYRHLVDWYYTEYAHRSSLRERIKNDPILQMIGLGKDVWKDEPADEYVRRLREEWD